MQLSKREKPAIEEWKLAFLLSLNATLVSVSVTLSLHQPTTDDAGSRKHVTSENLAAGTRNVNIRALV